jgi:hypothetical protein
VDKEHSFFDEHLLDQPARVGEFGVPHIYGPDLPTVIRGYGYAQMENHAELILQNIALARALFNQLRQRLTIWLPSYR